MKIFGKKKKGTPQKGNVFEERRSCFSIEFRVYVNKKLHNEYSKKMDKTVEESFSEVFGYESATTGVTM